MGTRRTGRHPGRDHHLEGLTGSALETARPARRCFTAAGEELVGANGVPAADAVTRYEPIGLLVVRSITGEQLIEKDRRGGAVAHPASVAAGGLCEIACALPSNGREEALAGRSPAS
jgi:hypothetical protein